MRHIFTLAALSPLLLMGQSLVDQMPQNRIALLEDFTGVNCGFCPDGHVIMANLEAALPGQIVNVGIHAGPFATPSAGQPDFRTPEGDVLDAFFPISGYPNGVINRHTFSSGLALSRTDWEPVVNEIITLPSPVNVGVESSFDAGTRDLTVTVELYYTDNSPGGNDFVSVMIKEDHIIGYQAGSGGSASYDHTHVLRDMLTPAWGEDLGSNPTAGTSITRTYTFNVPMAWDISNCKVVAFASEYQSEVYQAKEVKADGGTTLVTGVLNNLSTTEFIGSQPSSNEVMNTQLTNALGASEDYMIELVSANTPSDWGGGYIVNGNIYIAPSTFTVANGATLPIDVQITPGASAAIANYTLKITSITYPTAPTLMQDYHVISGVTDLVLENLGAEDWTPLYSGGLAAANQSGRASTTRAIGTAFGDANALTGVNNIYYNVSWTFPGLVDETVNVLESFMNAGGNLLIAGQDIGWDNSGAAMSNGTPITQAFYSNYMLATYLADGDNGSNQINFISNDAIFGAMTSTTINNVFGASFSYPEEIAPNPPAEAIMYYNDTSTVGAIRGETANYKMVYFGVGMEQFGDATIAEQVVKLSHDWFYGIVSVEEFDAAMAALGQAFPVPADQQVSIPLNELRGPATLRILAIDGKVMSEHSIPQGTKRFILDTSELASGVYAYQLVATDGSVATRKMTVSH